MRPKHSEQKVPAEKVLKDIRRATRRHFSAEDKIGIVLDGLRGEESIAELCRREGIAQSLYYTWSKEFLEAGKRRLAGDTARAATTDEVKGLRQETTSLRSRVRVPPVSFYSIDSLFRVITQSSVRFLRFVDQERIQEFAICVL